MAQAEDPEIKAQIKSLERQGYFVKKANLLPREITTQAWELDRDFIQLSKVINQVKKTPQRSSLYSTYLATRYLIENQVPGHFVECGVYWGKQVMMMALTLMELETTDRDIWLYDTFEGMTRPGPEDARTGQLKFGAEWSLKKWQESSEQLDGEAVAWAYAPLEQVQANVALTNYPSDRLHYVAGNVLETLPNTHHEEIAFLRLDTDFYDSTKHEFETLYDKVVQGGVISIDDYGAWQGSRKATDEFLAARGLKPLLFPVNYTERLFIKM